MSPKEIPWNALPEGHPSPPCAVSCGNPRHPNGAGHPAASIPASWEWLASFRYWLNRKRWGCGCEVRKQAKREPWRPGGPLPEWITSTTVDVTSPTRALVNGRAYAVPEGCRFIAFRLADGAPVDNETKLPLPEAAITGSVSGKVT